MKVALLFGSFNPIHEGHLAILRYLVEYKSLNRRSLFGYISDQTPKWDNIHLWLPFLNHDTPVFTGNVDLWAYFNMLSICSNKTL